MTPPLRGLCIRPWQITVPSLGPISSTEVRAAIKAGDYALAAAALHPDVLRYISQRGLYSVEDR